LNLVVLGQQFKVLENEELKNKLGYVARTANDVSKNTGHQALAERIRTAARRVARQGKGDVSRNMDRICGDRSRKAATVRSRTWNDNIEMYIMK
jgi:hypothetical protein